MLENGMIIGGRYEVEKKIGTGGMADVYRAKDHTLGRSVAIKVLRSEYCEDESFVVKFRAEATAAAGLEHPNIVNIYDVGSQDAFHYIIMEYVQGITLKTYIEKKGRLNYKETLSIAIQVARGIQAAHAKNIIHRDIKPQNIMISSEGKVKVTDFGIASAVSGNTMHADVMGTVHYASPEQSRNGYISNSSDIYSLGIVMYEMVTGRVPFDGENAVAVAIKHLQEEMVAPSVYAQDLPVSLEKIILKCTQKSADRRYDSMENLLVDLRKSLLTPNEDFVTMPVVHGAETRVVSDQELKEIKETPILVPTSATEGPEGYDEDEDEEDDDEAGFFNAKMEKIVKILSAIVGVIIVLVVLYLVLSFFGIIDFSNKSAEDAISVEEEIGDYEMISLLGMTVEEAEEALAEAGMDVTVDVIEEVSADEYEGYEAGQIVSQSAAEGDLVESGDTISVVIVAASEDVTVPDVVGYTSDSAVATLEDLGFKVVREFQYDSTVSTGQVISQTPESGTVAQAGDTITLYVSQGTETTKVPDLSGMTESAANTALGDAGLNIGTVTEQYSDSVAEGNVISQSVTAGQYVDMGTSVSYVVSKGAKETTYYAYNKISAPTNVTVDHAEIELLKAESDEVIQTWSNVTTFPYTISVTGITGTNKGTLVIVWYYYNSDGEVVASSPQEETVTFNEE